MDKSEKYIEMCRKASNIQAEWAPCLGDVYADCSNFIHFYMPQKDGVIRKGFGIKSFGNLVEIRKYTWLPRLNQLMEIAGSREKDFRNSGFNFFEWTKKNGYKPDAPENPYLSLEQIWLVYIMEKNFLKKWENRQWMALY